MPSENELTAEAQVFGKFLIGEQINDRVVGLYIEAHRHVAFDMDDKDQRLLKFVLSHPFWVGYVDGGLAILKKRSGLRKKLYYLLAILEAMPEYIKHFTSSKRSPIIGLFEIGLFGVRGVFRAIVGSLLCAIL